jgi:hypothetical protein
MTLNPLFVVGVVVGLLGVLIIVSTAVWALATRCKANDGTEVMPSDSRD